MIHETPEPLAFIMEDDPKLAFIFEKCVRSGGFKTIVAKDGGEAVEIMDKYTPDLFILDLHVPVYSGDQILEMVKANPRFDHAKLILATADARMAEALRPQVHFVLDKPISSRQLKRLTERLAEQVRKPA
ncbi:MAG: response regulator [Chloroflexota bacterium]